METTYNHSSRGYKGQPIDQTSLVVDNLHKDVTEQELYIIFHPFGPICSVQVCRNTTTGWSRGYGFVTFENRCDAEIALKALNLSRLMDIPMHITWAQYMSVDLLTRPNDELVIYDALSNFGEIMPCRVVSNSNGTPEEEQTAPRQSSSDATLLVSNLNSNVTEQDLCEVFLKFGPICTVRVCRDRETNFSHGYGFVTFEHQHDAERALAALNSTELMGKPVFIMWGQDMGTEVLAWHDSRDMHAEEIYQPEAKEPSRGRRLANAAKVFFTTLLTSPEAWVSIGLMVLAYKEAS